MPTAERNGHVEPPVETRLNATPVLMISALQLISQDVTRLELDEAHVQALVEDIRRRMVEKPDEPPIQTPFRVVRRGEKYLIVAGNHRYAAGLRIPLAEYPCLVLPDDLDEVGFIIEAARDNEMHHPYTPVERARLICLVAEKRGCTAVQAAKLLGIKGAKTESEVSKHMRVLRDYPADLHPLIGEGDGRVPFTTAYLISRIPDEPKKRELADKVMKGFLTRDAAVEEVTRLLTGGKTPKGKSKPVKVRLRGITVVFDEPDAATARRLLGQVDAGVVKVEKNQLPFQSLPQMFRDAPPAH